MNKTSKIYVAGHTGLVGSAIIRNLLSKGYNNIIGKKHKELDLLNQNELEKYLLFEKPEFVIYSAAKVGGIHANNTYRAQFIYENLQIQNNIIHSSFLAGVKKLLFLGSSCIYPKDAPQPIKEEYLLTSPLEYTNEPYAIAKIAGIRMCESYNIQYGTNFISVMPTNLYGPGDNYDLEKSHVLPALIRKIHLAKCLENNEWEAIRKDLNSKPIEGITGNFSTGEIYGILSKYGVSESSVTLWGSGKPLREFMHSDDLADACVFLMENVDFEHLKGEGEIRNTHINIGTGKDLSIAELAELIKKTVGFTGKIIWDSSKPDGTYRKLLDVTRLNSLGWKYKIELEDGIRSVYERYINV